MNIQEIVTLLRGCQRDTAGTTSSSMFGAAARDLESYIPLAVFGAKVLKEFRGPSYYDVGDVDGGFLQDAAVECGALMRINAPCTPNQEDCACHDNGQDYCYHVPQSVRQASLALDVRQRGA